VVKKNIPALLLVIRAITPIGTQQKWVGSDTYQQIHKYFLEQNRGDEHPVLRWNFHADGEKIVFDKERRDRTEDRARAKEQETVVSNALRYVRYGPPPANRTNQGGNYKDNRVRFVAATKKDNKGGTKPPW